uniref:NDL-4 n=1 Tax=Dendrocoelum lacteum TaxID=27895 RepID=T1DF76_9PLAT
MLIIFILWISFQQYVYGNIIPVVYPYKSNLTSRIGGTIMLTCPISVNNEQSTGFYINWSVNGIDENMLSVDMRYQFKESNKILEVSNLRSDDSGIYICKGVNGYGVKKAVFYLVVKDEKFCRIPVNATPKTKFKPCFLNSLMQNEVSYQKIIRDVGSSVEFDCSAAGSPAPKYLWTKGKSSADWIDNITGIRQPILRINRVLLEYSGYYTCKVSNSVGEISYTYTLIVREKHSKIPKIENNLGNITANIGAQAMLVGSITCNCKPVLQWLKRIDNRSMLQKEVPLPNPRASEKNEFYVIIEPDNSDIPIETIEKNNEVLVSVLKFKSVVPSDSGKYILFATNGNYGMSYGVTYLEIREDPESAKKNHPRLVLYIAIPIIILILCFGVIFYCWSRRHSPQRVECPKRFCIGSSSVSSSTNIKSIRSHYPGSTTTASATTGKCSNNSSIFGKKTSMSPNDGGVQHHGNVIPLLSQQNCNRPFSPIANGNEINQDNTINTNINTNYPPHFTNNKDVSPYSYSKMPAQQVIFPHSNSRVSNSSQPNTQSGSSNCSDHTNKSYSNNQPQNIPSQTQTNIHPSIFNGVTTTMPSYVMSKALDQACNNQMSSNDQFYQQYPDGMVQVPSNVYYTQDYYPAINSSSPSNAYSYS